MWEPSRSTSGGQSAGGGEVDDVDELVREGFLIDDKDVVVVVAEVTGEEEDRDGFFLFMAVQDANDVQLRHLHGEKIISLGFLDYSSPSLLTGRGDEGFEIGRT